MSKKRIADMTLEELKQLINEQIQQVMTKPADKPTMAEVNAAIRRNRIASPPGSKSALDMLRETRDA